MSKIKSSKFCRHGIDSSSYLERVRLTVWYLMQARIETKLICDSMATRLMQQGRIQAVFLGADRIAVNGDTANKIGTLGLSIAARHFDVPYYVAAPSSTFDLTLADGTQIPIEERDGDEIRRINDHLIAPQNVGVWNPAFDVTPAGHTQSIITERGLIRPTSRQTIAAALFAPDTPQPSH